jgi:hypothetical protein
VPWDETGGRHERRAALLFCRDYRFSVQVGEI